MHILIYFILIILFIIKYLELVNIFLKILRFKLPGALTLKFSGELMTGLDGMDVRPWRLAAN